jgi:hypothetical protein
VEVAMMWFEGVRRSLWPDSPRGPDMCAVASFLYTVRRAGAAVTAAARRKKSVLCLYSTLSSHIAYLPRAVVHVAPCVILYLSAACRTPSFASSWVTAAPCPFCLSNQVACPRFEGVVPMTTMWTTTTTTVRETPVGGTTTCHYAVEFARNLFFLFLPCSMTRHSRTVAVLLLLAPHPSILHVLLNYHYLTLRAPLYFVAHLLIIYALSFLAFSSLIACVVRDPGPVPAAKSEDPHDVGGGGGGDEISIEDALLNSAPPSSDDYTQPGRWCRICWKPKPERAHHCSQCGRCVLKMGACDGSSLSVSPPECPRVLSHRAHTFLSIHATLLLDHHCPWLGAKCIVRRCLQLPN